MTNYKDFGFDESRLQKRMQLISEGVNPYPYSFEQPTLVSQVVDETKRREEAGEELLFTTMLIGRVWAKREMGRTCFMDLRDKSGKIQLYLVQKKFDKNIWGQILLVDLGDIIGVEGNVFRTKSGELTINVDSLTILSKTVVPIPMGKEVGEKSIYRLSDAESKYRERYLHWLLDDEDRIRIQQRSRIISSIRRRMETEGFLEVSTPTIEFVYGGAEARPFRTSIWALSNSEAFLRISPELYLKRYLVAGFEKVFTICQNFRNEGIDHSHNPEFTMMEWYEAYTDYQFQMHRFETLVAGVCEEICGTTQITYQGVNLNFQVPWRRITVLDALKQFAGIDASVMSVGELRTELDRRNINYSTPLTWGVAVIEFFEATCEEHLIQPTFILDHPIEISPLTKVKRGDKRLVERFEPYAFKMEIGNAYSELTDPVVQLERLIEQRGNRGDNEEYETHPIDADFVKAVGCGMPPTGGVGLGVDRLIMLLTDAPSIRDIIPFPMVKPKN
jgi:lysyl-tRNA synthetase class 2